MTSNKNSDIEIKNKNINEDITLFIKYLSIEKQLSPNTIENYHRDLKAFQTFCDDQQIKNVAKIDESAIRQFISLKHRKGIGGKTLQRNLSSLRSFFNYL